jgi:FAD/FMN-containing dehydrogenase/pimeloyl-ACP methyl ester carboxylesterase
VSETTHAGAPRRWVVLRKSRPSAGATVGGMLESHVDDARRTLLTGLPVAERRLGSTAILEGGDGPPIVLLHGPGSYAAHWLRAIPGLVGSHRVVAPDLPGHGESGPRDGEGEVLAWLAELIEQTCTEPPVLVGNALGGAIAARFAIAHGDRIRRLVLVDPLGLALFDPAPEFGRALHEFMAEPDEDTHERLWRYCAHDLEGVRAAFGRRWAPFAAYNVDRARTRGAAGGAMMQELGIPAIEGLERITVPVALVWGRQDLANPLAVAEAAAARHGWPLHVIEDCADDPPVERPDELLRALAAEDLRERLDGDLLLPGDPAFGAATELWNAMIAKTPALVVQAAGTEDVVAAVRFAAAHGLALSVRGGGHNIAGSALADGGVTIDMSRLRDVVVDPDARTATVQPGCLLGDVDRATQRHGLATPLGFFSDVGVAGLTLGGGLGYLTRRFGWTVDNLLAVDIVTADGAVRQASRDEHADLFWAVRGAGANLGVVTSFTFRVHPVGPTVYGGLIAWPFELADDFLRAYRTVTTEGPDELTAFLMIARAPAAPFVPAEWHHRRMCALSICFSGDLGDAEAAVAPLRAIGDPIVDLLREQPYTELQSYLDATEPKGRHDYWRMEYASELSDGLLASFQALAGDCPIPDGELGLLHLGGALNEHAGDDGAVGNRDARYAWGIIGMWDPSDPHGDAHRRWVREAADALKPFSTGGTYVNFQTADEGADRVRAAYGANYERLRQVKRAYDPGNLFRSNRNVR